MVMMKNKLETLLLSNGGNSVINGHETDTEINLLITKGKLFNLNGLSYYKSGMKPNQCHRNSAILFSKKKTYKLITGYAMFNGEWLSHSWLFNGRNIIETCPVVFEEYFGYELTGMYLDDFLYENY